MLSGKRCTSGDVVEVHVVGGFCDFGRYCSTCKGRRGCQNWKTIDVWLSERISEVCAGFVVQRQVGEGRRNDWYQIVGENVAFGNSMDRGISFGNIAEVCEGLKHSS